MRKRVKPVLAGDTNERGRKPEAGVTMIVRVWHGRTSLEKADAYAQFLVARAIPDYRGTVGNLGAFVLQRRNADCAHFLAVSIWPSYEVIRNFAGEEIERAKYYDEDADYLLEFEPNVTHYELVDAAVERTFLNALWQLESEE